MVNNDATDFTTNLYRQSRTLITKLPDPLTETTLCALQEEVFRMLKSKGLRSVVLDFSAVDSIDTSALQNCRHLIEGARLLGAKVAVAALHPHVAATAVDLGEFFLGVHTCTSVHRAIQIVQE